jgi:hypothetical protein
VKEGNTIMKKIMTLLIVMLCAIMLFTSCSGDTGTPKSEESGAADAQSQATEEESAEAADESEQVQAPAAAMIEPEQLISLEEAEALLGEKLTGEKSENAVVGQKRYFYKSADDSSDQYLQISLTQQAFMPEGSAFTPEQLYKDICAAFEGEPVTGLGDEAQIIPSGYQIMCEGYYLTVMVGYTSDDDAILSEASKTAVENLKALLG